MSIVPHGTIEHEDSETIEYEDSEVLPSETDDEQFLENAIFGYVSQIEINVEYNVSDSED